MSLLKKVKAVQAARACIQDGLVRVADIDLDRFFDQVQFAGRQTLDRYSRQVQQLAGIPEDRCARPGTLTSTYIPRWMACLLLTSEGSLVRTQLRHQVRVVLQIFVR